MFLDTQPFYVRDFRGGITDFYLGAPPQKCKTANNLLIEQYGEVGKLVTRQGSEIINTTNPQPGGVARIGELWLYRNSVFQPSGIENNFQVLLINKTNTVVYQDTTGINYTPGSIVTIKGRTPANIIESISAPAAPAVFSFPRHGFGSGNTGVIIQLTTTGALPPPLVTGTNYFVVNAVQDVSFELSLTSGGPSIATTGVGAGEHSLIVQSANNVYRPSTTADKHVCMANWKEFIFTCSDDGFTKPQKMYVRDYAAPLITQNSGLPAILGNISTSSNVIAPQGNYIYALHFQANFYTRGIISGEGIVQYIDVGPVRTIEFLNATEPNVSPISFDVQALSTNGRSNNYPEVTVQLYRTTSNGTVFYRVGQFVPGTSFSDTMSDATLSSQSLAPNSLFSPLLYTEGGVVDFQEVPSSRFVHIVNDTGYYGYTSEYPNGEPPTGSLRSYPNKAIQSIPGVPGSTNGSFFVEFDEEIKGISSYQGVPLYFCDNSVYRIEGAFDELGRGGMFPKRISKEASCISHYSIVQTNEGVFWWGKKGVYYTDGYRCMRVSDGWVNTYEDLAVVESQKLKIRGKLDNLNRRIYWTVQESGEADCNKVYVLDLNYGISDDMPFTSISGTEESDSFAPTAVEFNISPLTAGEAEWFRADRRGYLFQHRPTLYSDPKVDILTAVTSWVKTPIIYTYISAAHNFGMSFTRYWVPRVDVQCKNVTNLSLQLISNNDDGKKTANLSPIKFRGNVTWGDPDVVWGDPSLIWNQTGFIEAQRRFPARGLRCSFKQIAMTNAFIAITNSDLLGMATLDTVLNTVTLVGTWPTNSVGYVIAFEADNYTQEFAVVSRTPTVLTFSDPGGDSPASGSVKWVLRGFPVDEVFSMESYTIHFAPLGKTQEMYQTSDSGENG